MRQLSTRGRTKPNRAPTPVVARMEAATEFKARWTIVSFLCPAVATGAALLGGDRFAVGAGLGLTGLFLIAVVTALVQREKARWLTLIPLATMIGSWFIHL